MHRTHTTMSRQNVRLASKRIAAFAVIAAGLATVPGSIGAGADRITPDAAVQSTVWLDTNLNGIRDRSEAGISDVQVSLLNCDGAFLAATRTDQRGVYRFDVPSGCYRVRVARGPQQKFCPAGLGADRSRDSDVDPATGVSAPLDVATGEQRARGAPGKVVTK